jgi:hypothetical protein
VLPSSGNFYNSKFKNFLEDGNIRKYPEGGGKNF